MELIHILLLTELLMLSGFWFGWCARGRTEARISRTNRTENET